MVFSQVAFFERRGFTDGPESNWESLGDVKIIDERISDQRLYQESLKDFKNYKHNKKNESNLTKG